MAVLANLLPFLNPLALVPIVICAAAGFCLPALRRPSPMLVLNAMVAAAIYRTAFFGYALWILILYGFTRGVELLNYAESRRAADRWNYACAAMAAVLILYAAAALGWFNVVRVGAFTLAALVPLRDMWLLLRSISFLWEFGSGRIKENRFLTYTIWMSFPFTMIGPLIRYSEFAPQFARHEQAAPSRATLDREWWNRLGLAIVQMAVGVVCSYLAVRIDALPQHWPKLLIIFGFGPWGFYLTIGGILHLMECLAKFWEIELPLSFNRPFEQPNLSEFWNRWNMTVTRLCRDYLFYNRWGFKRSNVYVNLVIVFLAVGLWHSMNLYWASWGLLHGAGFCVYLWYRTHKERFGFIGELVSARARRIASVALTYAFVCLCWYAANKIAFALHDHLPRYL